MSRLPKPGSDEGAWGDILNDFLSQAHNSDGTLKSSSTAAAGAEQSINKGAVGGYAPLDSSAKVPAANLPPTTVPDASSGAKGVVQLAGDLTGSASVPTIAANSITDAKVATNANISKSKLASLGITDADVSSISENKITNLTSDLASKVSTSRSVNTGTGLSGGGDLTADRTLSVAYGTTAGTAAQGNDSRLSDSRPPAGSAGGDLTGTYPNPILTVDRIPKNMVTTKGDLIAATGSAALARLGAGNNYQHLIADSSTSTGLKWANREVYNVKDYGAMGDGSTDDTTALQSVINAAQTAGGGRIVFPNGTYLTGELSITGSHIILEGASSKASLLRLKANTAASVVRISSGSDTKVVCLGFDGNASNTTQPTIQYINYSGVQIEGSANDVEVASCTFSNFWVSGVMIGQKTSEACSVTRINVHDNRTTDIYDNHIFVRPLCNYVTVANNIIGPTKIVANTATNGTGTFSGTFTITVASTASFPATGHLVMINTNGAQQNVSYTGKTATTFTGVTGGTGTWANGVAVLYQGYGGLAAIKSDYVVFDGNQVYNCGPGQADASACSILACRQFAITNNVFDRCFPNGIWLDSSTEGGDGSTQFGALNANRFGANGVVVGNQILGQAEPSGTGVLLGNVHDVLIDGNEVTGYNYSLADAGFAGTFLGQYDLMVTNNLFSTSLSNGVQFSIKAQNTTTGRNVLRGNLITGSGVHGCFYEGPSATSTSWLIDGNTIINAQQQGLVVNSGKDWVIKNNYFAANGQTPLANGILNASTDGLVEITSNHFVNENSHQVRALYENSASVLTRFTRNRCAGTTGFGDWSFSNSSSVAFGNDSSNTKDHSSGNTSVSGTVGGVTTNIAHGLYKAPALGQVSVIATGDPGVSVRYYVSAVDATNITITGIGGTATFNVAWSVDLSR